jgi:hypothetical protein
MTANDSAAAGVNRRRVIGRGTSPAERGNSRATRRIGFAPGRPRMGAASTKPARVQCSGMTQGVEKLIEQVRALSPEERVELRTWINSASDLTPEDGFARKLIELHVGDPRPAGPRHPNPQPIHAAGKPLSEELIEERR